MESLAGTVGLALVLNDGIVELYEEDEAQVGPGIGLGPLTQLGAVNVDLGGNGIGLGLAGDAGNEELPISDALFLTVAAVMYLNNEGAVLGGCAVDVDVPGGLVIGAGGKSANVELAVIAHKAEALGKNNVGINAGETAVAHVGKYAHEGNGVGLVTVLSVVESNAVVAVKGELELADLLLSYLADAVIHDILAGLAGSEGLLIPSGGAGGIAHGIAIGVGIVPFVVVDGAPLGDLELVGHVAGLKGALSYDVAVEGEPVGRDLGTDVHLLGGDGIDAGDAVGGAVAGVAAQAGVEHYAAADGLIGVGVVGIGVMPCNDALMTGVVHDGIKPLLYLNAVEVDRGIVGIALENGVGHDRALSVITIVGAAYTNGGVRGAVTAERAVKQLVAGIAVLHGVESGNTAVVIDRKGDVLVGEGAAADFGGSGFALAQSHGGYCREHECDNEHCGEELLDVLHWIGFSLHFLCYRRPVSYADRLDIYYYMSEEHSIRPRVSLQRRRYNFPLRFTVFTFFTI